MSTRKSPNGIGIVILLLIAIPIVLIWQRDFFPGYVVALGTILCLVFLFLYFRKATAKKK